VGAEIDFEIKDSAESIKVFTTRPDTIFGATFVVLAPEHEILNKLSISDEVAEYIKKAGMKTELERQETKDKTGVRLDGVNAINPASGEKIPVFVADYVLPGYGTGAIMAVPAHDERDNEFAAKFDLPINEVIEKPQGFDGVYTGEGKLINSGDYNGLDSSSARERIVAGLEHAVEKTNYKMRDWSVSRQRYWGAPIPVIHCPNCGPQLVPEDQLPVLLPELEDFEPAGDGRSALARAADWLKVDCPNCGGPAERETDTMDTYVDSGWYMYRYMDPHNQHEIFDKDVVQKWEPIDFYNGADHATAHLLYARFIGHFFRKIGLVNQAEPFKQ
jgi:leucyl-tRNA synthetase